jgi:hypothetical protein
MAGPRTNTANTDPSGWAADTAANTDPHGWAADNTGNTDPSGWAADNHGPKTDPSGWATDNTANTDPNGWAADNADITDPIRGAPDTTDDADPTGEPGRYARRNPNSRWFRRSQGRRMNRRWLFRWSRMSLR